MHLYDNCGGVESDLAVQRQETMKHVLGLHVLNWSREFLDWEMKWVLSTYEIEHLFWSGETK